MNIINKILAGLSLVLAVGAMAPTPALASEIQSTASKLTVKPVDSSAEGKALTDTIQKALRYVFLFTGVAFIAALAWAGWQVYEKQDLAPLKWTLIGLVIYALAGVIGNLVMGWAS